MKRKPSAELRAALLGVDELQGAELLPPVWSEELEHWMLRLTLEAPHDTPEIARLTDWVVLVADAYPLGEIEFFPAANERGLEATFPHQRANVWEASAPFRDGKLCLDEPGHVIDPFGMGREPRRAEHRLRWHVERALAWLAAAARDELLRPGDPFELPVLPRERAELVAFCEGPDTYPPWISSKASSGAAVLRRLQPRLLVTTKFTTWKGEPISESRWGLLIEGKEETSCAWIRLAGPPTQRPWKWPLTWADIRASAGSSLDDELEKVLQHLRDGKSHLVLIGFPIPSVVGGAVTELHWSCARVGPFAPLRPGQSAKALWQRDRTRMFGGQRVEWCSTENWHPTRLGARGQLSPALRAQRIALVGGGALGSVIADLLVRAGPGISL